MSTTGVGVWIFKGPKRFPAFPSAVFLSLALGEEWVSKNAASGTFTRYPVNTGVYQWAIDNNLFKAKKEEHRQPNFIENFTTAYQEHYHYENGQLTSGRNVEDVGTSPDGDSNNSVIGESSLVAEDSLWVFIGPKHYPGFPSAVFLNMMPALEWIHQNGLSGTLICYPVNTGIYEWATTLGLFRPESAEHRQPQFIESFSSTRQEHYHFDNGQLSAS